MSTRTVTLLLVEDNEVDVEAVRRGLASHRIANPVVVASDGVEALEMLRGGEVERPFFVLLDLNLPRMDGHEFLQRLRADDALHDAVVMVLTTSRDEYDVQAAYEQHVAGYIVKRDVGAGFVRLVELLDHYWKVVELPEANS